MKIGFDNDKYLKEQTQAILKRAEKFKGGKLYIECGGKLLWDMHASRILPGFDPCVKMRVFSSLTDKIDVIFCVHAEAIETRKIRGDFGITYEEDTIKTINDFRNWNIQCNKVVITRFNGEIAALRFKERLESMGIKVYLHKSTPGYPLDVDRIVSDEGYGANPYIETDKSKPIIIVNAPGPGSGKLGTCLSQIYHDYRSGRKSGYAKFETFPVWNLPVEHPVNIAYESATADLGDVNMIDHFYVQNTGKVAVNYNRDIEAFPLLKRILEKISGDKSMYSSPTDMGVNRIGFGIIDDGVCREASNQEIIRRALNAKVDVIRGTSSKQAYERAYEIMQRAGLTFNMRPTLPICNQKLSEAISKGRGKDGIVCTACMELPNGNYVTGCNSPLMHASTALVFNSLKELANIDDKELLLPEKIISSVKKMKSEALNEKGTSLNLEEGLICLALAAPENKKAEKAIAQLKKLRNCECHLSHIPSPGDMKGLRKLGIRFTSGAIYPL